MAGFGGGLNTGLNANVDLHAGVGAHLGAGYGYPGYGHGYHCAPGYSSAGVILVLFILLVIVVRAYL